MEDTIKGYKLLEKHDSLLKERIQGLSEKHILKYDATFDETFSTYHNIRGKFMISHVFSKEVGTTMNEIKMLDRVLSIYHRLLDVEREETNRKAVGIEHIIGDLHIEIEKEDSKGNIIQVMTLPVVTHNIFED